MASVDRWKGNKWRARWRTTAGESRSQVFGRRIDAERHLTATEHAKMTGGYVDPGAGRLTFEAWVDRWTPTIVDLRATTLDRDLRIVRNHLVPRFGTTPLAKVTTSAVRAWVAEMNGTGDHAPATVRKAGQVMAKVMAAAVSDGLIARSPCDGVRLPAESRREMVFLDAGQVLELVDVIDEHHQTLVLSAAYLGLRWGELAGLRTERVDVLRRRVAVLEQLVEVSGALSFGPPKTAAGRRSVTVPAFLVPYLEAQLLQRSSGGLVFPAPGGGPLRRSNFTRRVWTPATRRAGVDGLRFHDLRHTAVALAIGAGAHPKSIQERMGHSSVTVTLDRYGHLFPHLDERIADGLDAAWSAAVVSRSCHADTPAPVLAAVDAG